MSREFITELAEDLNCADEWAYTEYQCAAENIFDLCGQKGDKVLVRLVDGIRTLLIVQQHIGVFDEA